MRFSEKLHRELIVLCGVIAVAFAAAAGDTEAQTGQVRDTIYHKGQIIVYSDKDGPEEFRYEDAVAVRNGRILKIGTLDDVTAALLSAGSKRELIDVIDLKNKTLVPGFFDAHSHLVQVAALGVVANLLPPPDGTVKTIADIQRQLLEYKKNNPKATVIMGNGYDDSQLVDSEGKHRHPTWQELQSVSDQLPVIIVHQSGHYSVVNKVALDAFPITDTTADPVGGKIYRDAHKHATGLLGEKAHVDMARKYQPVLTEDSLVQGLNDSYAAQGFTTVQEARAFTDMIPLLEKSSPRFKADVVAYVDLEELLKPATTEKEKLYKNALSGKIARTTELPTYTNNFRIGGVKLVLDGSPQGRSAYVTEAYEDPPGGSETGAPNYTDGDLTLKYRVRDAYNKGWQLLVHANGDAAVDQLIRCDFWARDRTSPKNLDRRTVLIHGQFMRDDQITHPNPVASIQGHRIFPSLFPMHTFYWGDWYRTIIGDQRAEFISPTKAVQKEDMMFSIHTDAPVTGPPNSMRLLDSAVNRTTRGGWTAGKDQRISPIVALKAMTLWPAYQHFEEKTKGSIAVGKLADFVILSHNPMTIPEKDRKNLICIQIVDTIKAGKSIHPRPTMNVEGGRPFGNTCHP